MRAAVRAAQSFVTTAIDARAALAAALNSRRQQPCYISRSLHILHHTHAPTTPLLISFPTFSDIRFLMLMATTQDRALHAMRAITYNMILSTAEYRQQDAPSTASSPTFSSSRPAARRKAISPSLAICHAAFILSCHGRYFHASRTHTAITDIDIKKPLRWP